MNKAAERRYQQERARNERRHLWLRDMQHLYDFPRGKRIECTQCGATLEAMDGDSYPDWRAVKQAAGWHRAFKLCRPCTAGKPWGACQKAWAAVRDDV